MSEPVCARYSITRALMSLKTKALEGGDNMKRRNREE